MTTTAHAGPDDSDEFSDVQYLTHLADAFDRGAEALDHLARPRAPGGHDSAAALRLRTIAARVVPPYYDPRAPFLLPLPIRGRVVVYDAAGYVYDTVWCRQLLDRACTRYPGYNDDGADTRRAVRYVLRRLRTRLDLVFPAADDATLAAAWAQLERALADCVHAALT